MSEDPKVFFAKVIGQLDSCLERLRDAYLRGEVRIEADGVHNEALVAEDRDPNLDALRRAIYANRPVGQFPKIILDIDSSLWPLADITDFGEHAISPLRGTKMIHREVRRASVEDVAVLTEIRNDAHRKKVSYGDYVWGKEGDGFSERWVLDHVGKREVYLVEQAELTVATFTLDFGPDPHWEGHELAAGYVHGLCVRNGFNAQGLGSFMLDWSTNKIRDLNLRYIRLDCDLKNRTLCGYYESLGFVQAGIKREEVAWALYEKLVNYG